MYIKTICVIKTPTGIYNVNKFEIREIRGKSDVVATYGRELFNLTTGKFSLNACKALLEYIGKYISRGNKTNQEYLDLTSILEREESTLTQVVVVLDNATAILRFHSDYQFSKSTAVPSHAIASGLNPYIIRHIILKPATLHISGSKEPKAVLIATPTQDYQDKSAPPEKVYQAILEYLPRLKEIYLQEGIEVQDIIRGW